jgi:2,3-bisphosphoglycerate-dependent phosphoglycerate mutase
MNVGPTNLRHRPFLTPIWLTALAAFMIFAVALVAAVVVWKLGTSDSTTLVVIRHAEKDLAGGGDPGLSPEGTARAALLAHMFAGNAPVGRLDAIYVSPTVRTQATAAPLASALNLTPVVSADEGPKALARRALHEHAGGRVLIVGHSVTVPAIVTELTGNHDIPIMGESEYGTMYIVTVPRIGHANFVRLNY